MPIPLGEPTTERSPVLKRRRIGEEFVGMLLIAPEQRNSHKDGKPAPKRDVDAATLADPSVPDSKKYRQELVVTMLCVTSTMNAGLGDTEDVAQPGDVVRMILRGGGFGQWIEAKKTHGALNVGDVVRVTSTYGQAYDAAGSPSGPHLTTQAECDAVPRTQSLGIYGDLTISSADAADPNWATWLDAAEAKHHELTAAARPAPTPLDTTPSPAPAPTSAPTPAPAPAAAPTPAPGPFAAL